MHVHTDRAEVNFGVSTDKFPKSATLAIKCRRVLKTPADIAGVEVNRCTGETIDYERDIKLYFRFSSKEDYADFHVIQNLLAKLVMNEEILVSINNEG